MRIAVLNSSALANGSSLELDWDLVMTANARPLPLLLRALLLTATVLYCIGDEPAKSLPGDGEYRRLVVGTWQDEYQGKRTMTVRPDGTATMVVQLHGWKAALYASRLKFEMVWSITDGRLQKRTTGGEPAGKVKAILKMMGDRVDEKILELTAERLLLLDQNGKRKYDWRRVTEPAKDGGSASH